MQLNEIIKKVNLTITSVTTFSSLEEGEQELRH